MNRLKLMLVVMIFGSYAFYLHNGSQQLNQAAQNFKELYTNTIATAQLDVGSQANQDFAIQP